jgi:hypothetical protein
MLFRARPSLPSVAFATSCWERDWKHILLDTDYLRQKQIANQCFAFAEKIVVINNVASRADVLEAAQKRVSEGTLTKVVLAEESVLSTFGLKREDFQPGADADQYEGVNADWIYYNALAPLSAIHAAKSDYLLYLTGDVRLDAPLDWIEKAIKLMEKDPRYKVANPVWNGKVDEAKRESMRRKKGFYVSDRGFSDQLFLVRRSDFAAPIYGEIREDAAHFPRGDVFEKRVFSAMRNRGWLRLTYSKGSYTHETF